MHVPSFRRSELKKIGSAKCWKYISAFVVHPLCRKPCFSLFVCFVFPTTIMVVQNDKKIFYRIGRMACLNIDINSNNHLLINSCHSCRRKRFKGHGKNCETLLTFWYIRQCKQQETPIASEMIQNKQILCVIISSACS